MAIKMKLVLPLLVVLMVSTDAKFPNLGQLLGKRPSKGINVPSIAEKNISKLPFKPPVSLRKSEAESPRPSPRPHIAPSAEKSSPKFCASYDCPNYYEINLNVTDYKLRCYPKPYSWVTTTVEGKNSRDAGQTAFWRLFRYIRGNNEEGMKIKMTVPVTMQIQPNGAESKSFCKNNFTMNFFIPFKHQKNAPSPSASDVHLTVVKPFCAYLKVYGGYDNIRKVEANYNALVKSLKRDGIADDFRTDAIYSASYDSPIKFYNRHNEIWLVSKKYSPALSVNKGEELEVDKL